MASNKELWVIYLHVLTCTIAKNAYIANIILRNDATKMGKPEQIEQGNQISHFLVSFMFGIWQEHPVFKQS